MTIPNQIRKSPFSFLKRVMVKKFITPLRYRSKDGYDAPTYWRDRFQKYGVSIKGPGHEGLSEEENQAMYQVAAKVFRAVCQNHINDFRSVRVLEIGVGTGFYTRILQESGVESYTGIDITDVLFPTHQKNFPFYRFQKADITKDSITGSFNVIVMIDVMQHIVNKEKLTFAMKNIKQSLAPGGIFIVGPVMHVTKKHLFYVHYWAKTILEKSFQEFVISEPVPFRQGEIIVIKMATAN